MIIILAPIALVILLWMGLGNSFVKGLLFFCSVFFFIGIPVIGPIYFVLVVIRLIMDTKKWYDEQNKKMTGKWIGTYRYK